MNRETAIPVEEIVKELAPRRRFQPYPEYRDSGSSWLGDIPLHWKVSPLKRLVSKIGSGKTPRGGAEIYGSEGVMLLRSQNIYDDGLRLDDVVFIDDAIDADMANTRLQSGDVLLNITGASIGRCAMVPPEAPPGNVNQHVCIIRPKAIQLAFLHATLCSKAIKDWIFASQNGTSREGLNFQQIGNMTVAAPPLEEQKAIAAFLDRETGRIDELIAKKQRLIELLAEKRTALISHAVTKGLNPDAPMKDSGIDWLGEVPTHWDIAPLYARYWLELGKMLDAKRITGEHLVPYVRNVDVQWDRVNIDDLPEMDIEHHEYRRFILADGDLLVCEGGEVGRSAIWCHELPLCAYQKAIHRLRPRSGVECVRFTFCVLRHAASTGIFLANGNPNTIPHLTGEQLRVYRLPFPPLEEQEAIVAHVDEQTIQLDDLSKRIHDAIDKLREYRTALISAAVTGKIDVRGAA